MPNRVQSGTLHLRDFQSGDRASNVFLNISEAEVINATDCLEPTWLMRLPPCKSSHCNFTLPMEFLPPSIFSFWWHMLLCLPLSLWMLTKFFLPLVYLHVSDTKCGARVLWPRVVFHPLTEIECLLPIKYSRSLELQTEKTDTGTIYLQGQTQPMCNGLQFL